MRTLQGSDAQITFLQPGVGWLENTSCTIHMNSFTAVHTDPASEYRLSDDVARLCLPQQFKDLCRDLAWANSVCVLFVAVGLVGLKQPPIQVRAVAPAEDIPHFERIPEPEPLEPSPVSPGPTEPTPSNKEIRQLPVAVLDPTGAKYLAPVDYEGPVLVLPRPSTPFEPGIGAASHPSPPRVTEFRPNDETEGGYYPKPDYPVLAEKMHYQGTCKIEMLVDVSGTVTAVKLMQSSGYSILDSAAMDIVKKRWHFPPGAARHFWYPFVFEMPR